MKVVALSNLNKFMNRDLRIFKPQIGIFIPSNLNKFMNLDLRIFKPQC
jgi:hypothetical protein